MSNDNPVRRGVAWASWRETLARKYPTVEEARSFVIEVGLDPIRIEFRNRADITWLNILEEAEKQGERWLWAVLDHAIRQFPDDEALRRLRDGAALRYAEGPDIASIGWRGRGGQVYERVTGKQSALVSVSFLEKGLRRARAVVRIKYQEGSLGTGFLIPGDLLVTNHHVLRGPQEAAAATAQFNYQKTAEGHDANAEELPLDPGAFFLTSKDDDITIVKVKHEPSKNWGAIELEDARLEVGERVNVIQHPGGEQKQLSFYHNLVEYVGEGRVQYLTDTLPGSSGSPVFDRDWRLVALHHTGGWMTEPGTKERFYRNEGIHVKRLLEALRKS
jgi:V8-like Glu-specific endopeptidase